MSVGDRYGAQTFVLDRKGQLGEGRTYACKDADEARRIASARVAGGYAAGAAAFMRRGGGEFDEGETVTFEVYGAVPPGVEDAVPF
ncbi:hypothetical protein [Methylobacterium radiodurans]|uniref:Uncharacterized protein n=1 Tax=Methylobacterium radiodurans TaxID=2202828 RepID=A0A2U8VQP8_9HYPH|nr:hypothetical protein [Methylobacterium radiodurans]AWN35751.1 hypothetical protein DK427_08340 [Methylobacterium radiodurans]